MKTFIDKALNTLQNTQHVAAMHSLFTDDKEESTTYYWGVAKR